MPQLRLVPAPAADAELQAAAPPCDRAAVVPRSGRLCRRCCREHCSDPATATFAVICMILFSNFWSAYRGPPHLRPGYVEPDMKPRPRSPVGGLPKVLPETSAPVVFTLVEDGAFPADGYYAGHEDGTPTLLACEQLCVEEAHCHMISWNPGVHVDRSSSWRESASIPLHTSVSRDDLSDRFLACSYTEQERFGAQHAGPNSCARFDLTATPSRMTPALYTTYAVRRPTQYVPTVRRPTPSTSTLNRSVAVIYVGLDATSLMQNPDLLDSQALLLNPLLRDYASE